MIAKDRTLLARLRTMNSRIGQFTVEMMHQQNSAELPADGLRPLAEHLSALTVNMRNRADELDGHIIHVEVPDE